MLKIAKKLKAVLEAFKSTNEELRIEEIQERLRARGIDAPKTTLRTWLGVLEELGLIKVSFRIERGRGARVVGIYSARILPGDIIVGIPVEELEELEEKSGGEVVQYLLDRSGYTEEEIEEIRQRSYNFFGW